MDVAELVAHGIDAAVPPMLRERGIKSLNVIQRTALDVGLLSGQNLVVSAPTSSGKTLIGELVAARVAGEGLTVFLCSHKALASQVHGIFATRYLVDGAPFLKAGILTRDQDTVHGEWSRFDVVVATYEKLYAELVAGARSLSQLRAVVADEVQIVGEAERGPGLELLLARLRHRSKNLQLVGLSATVPNGSLLADWLDAKHIASTSRTPPLQHEIWVPRARVVFRAGATEGERLTHSVDVERIDQVVERLLADDLGPVAVMATTRPLAGTYAEAVARARPTREDFPKELLDEFRGMGRETDLTETVCTCLLRGVGVHHADLTAEQRRVVEDAFLGGHLDVLVATPTLVAGVNLPIRTVIYPKMVRWNGQTEAPISRHEYINGSGRAGRQNLHDAGTSVILADSIAAAGKLSHYVLKGCEPVASQLGKRTPEYRVLHVLSSNPDATLDDLADVAERTFWARESGLTGSSDRRRALEEQISATVEDSRWASCWTRHGKLRFKLTRVGRTVAASGLEPGVALEAIDALRKFHRRRVEGVAVEKASRALLARLCTGSGMDGALPFDNGRNTRLAGELSSELAPHVPTKLNWTQSAVVAVGQALAAIGDTCVSAPLAERMARELAERTRVTECLSWLVSTASAMLDAEGEPGTEATVDECATLAEQLRFQVPARAVPIERLFAAHRVRHVGPEKRAKLVDLVGTEVGALLSVPEGALRKAVGERQVEGVRRAVLTYLEGLSRERSERQLREAEPDPELHELVRDLLRFSGTAFNSAVEPVLRALRWKVDLVPEDGPKKKADLSGSADDGAPALIECKTTENLAGEVSKKEAFDIQRKVPEGFGGHLLSIGRPVFSAAAIEHAVHGPGPLRVHLVTAGALAELLLACRLRGLPVGDAGAMLRQFAHIDVGRVRVELARRELPV